VFVEEEEPDDSASTADPSPGNPDFRNTHRNGIFRDFTRTAPPIGHPKPRRNQSSTGLPENLDDLDLYREFAFECNEHLENIEENILTLEREPHDIDLINAIFRPIHSMKGGAGFLSLRGINVLAHDTETLLDKCRKEEIEVTNQVVEACLRSVDALKHMVGNLVQVCDASDPTSVQVKPIVFASIREELKAIIEGRSPASPHPVPANSAPSKPAPAPEPPEEQTGDLSDENMRRAVFPPRSENPTTSNFSSDSFCNAMSTPNNRRANPESGTKSRRCGVDQRDFPGHSFHQRRCGIPVSDGDQRPGPRYGNPVGSPAQQTDSRIESRHRTLPGFRGCA
jgi:HPt (histidine-containing phosphotransfer) domain-containing protein